MDHLYISLTLDLSQKAPQGPGWYVLAHNDGNMLVAQTHISDAAAGQLAIEFQHALNSTDEEMPDLSIPQVVTTASGFIREAIEKQLKDAEEQAAKISILQKRLASLPNALP